MNLSELLKKNVQALVDEPGQVTVNEVAGDYSTVFEVRVAKVDVGKVIGRQGRMADALRTLLASWGAKARRRYVLEIIQ